MIPGLKDEAVQKVLAAKGNEINQLRETINTLRDIVNAQYEKG